MSGYSSYFCGVKINTWGTKKKPSSGLSNFVEQELFGGNVGHVSIEMILPSTEQIRAMIEKYCMKETFEQWKMKKSTASENATFNEYIKRSIKILPVRFVGHEVKRSVFNVRGKLKKDRFKNASEISYYKIDFSFWPGEHDPFYCSNIEEDMVNGRKGRHFEYSDVAKEYLQPEERIHRGVIGKRSMTYAPTIIAHQRDINDKEFERIRQAIELQKLTETLKVEELLSNKIENLKDQKIDDSLRKICLNIGLEIDVLVKEYMNANPLKRREKVNVEKFKEFFLQKINAHFSNLYSKNKQLKQKFKKEKPYLSQDKYFTRGVYPDHTQELPYRTETSRGLDPEAMLKKMREITKLGALKFNIHTNNCSKTSTAVLKAGAVHDPLLECVLGEEVLGFIGTPQQVIENAQRANYILAHDKQNTLFTRIANSDILNRAMGSFITNYQKEKLTAGQKVKAIAGIIGIGILKILEICLRVIVNPFDTMSDIISAVRTVFKNANSLLLKIGVGILSVIPMVVLSPFVIVEKGLEVLVVPFKILDRWFNKKPLSSKLDKQINNSPRSEYQNKGNTKLTNTDSEIAGLNERVAKRISENTRELISRKNTAMNILTQFEIDLEYTKNVVTLRKKDFDKLSKYLRKKHDPAITERFQKCCKESLRRANKLSPDTPSKVHAIVDEIKTEEAERSVRTSAATAPSKCSIGFFMQGCKKEIREQAKSAGDSVALGTCAKTKTQPSVVEKSTDQPDGKNSPNG